MHRLEAFLLLFGGAGGQQPGHLRIEQPMPLPLHACNHDGCSWEPANATLDANWRWLHGASPQGYVNCYTEQGWDGRLCPDEEACGANCAFDGVDRATYAQFYGIHDVPGGLQLSFQTPATFGSRMFVMDSPDTYRFFKLKNRELAIDIDVSSLGCGLNAAVHLLGMDRWGWQGMGINRAGAKYGVGYCDAQCPVDLKFVAGAANLEANVGSCCTELDVFEGNMWSQHMSVHPCDGSEPFGCVGEQCGFDGDGRRYMGSCDKDGCGFNPARMGFKTFFGPNGDTLDATRTFTVVTQFLTVDGTDTGELSEIRRYYLQDGMRFENPMSAWGSSISDQYCIDEKRAFHGTRPAGEPGEFNQFTAKGGMRKVGQALERGLVLALSLSDDPDTEMRWLDSASPLDRDPNTVAGVRRGPCPPSETTQEIRAQSPNAHATFTNIRYGLVGTTQGDRFAQFVVQKSMQQNDHVIPWHASLGLVASAVLFGLGVLVSFLSLRRRISAHSHASEVDPFIALAEEQR